MNPLRTVGGRLALALLVVVGGALAIVYLIVVPSYQSSLVDGTLKDLRHTLLLVEEKPRNSPSEPFPSDAWMQDEVGPIAIATGTRVAVFRAPPLLEPVADTNGGTSRDIERDPMARRAFSSGGVVSGSIERDGSTYAEAAVSLPGGQVLWASVPLHNELESVEVVRTRVILAATVATGVRDRARVPAGHALRAPGQAARERGRAGSPPAASTSRWSSTLHPRRARPARPGVRADAPSARLARPCARRVHRERLA